jgi:CCR4-NOT transcription complex subunit 1
MIAIQELDRRMSQMLSRNTLDRAEVEFVTELVREISTGESPWSSRNAFVHTLTSMLKLQENGMSDRGIDSLLASLRRSKVAENPRPASRHTPISDHGETVVIDEKKQAQLKHFFLDWVRTYQTSSDIETAFRPYITYLHNEGILIGEDITTAFYKMAIHVAVDSFGQIGQEENASIGTDSLAKLMILIVKNQYNNNRATVPDLARSSYYFRKIITILSYCLVERHMEMGDNFDQRPWTRIFTSILSELYQLGEQFSPLRRGCIRVLAKVLGTTQPVYAPRFAFGWMSIVSHRSFMPLLLFEDIEGSWSDYHKCLMWLLRFAEPFLKQGEMTHSSRSMYRGICRLFCVLMHDFPEFLDEYYHSFTTAIPPNCVQLRNIALSAFPIRDGPLPDPHRGLDHLLPEMQRYPIVRADYAEALEAGGIKAAIDQHVHTGMPGVDSIVAELRNRIAVKTLSADGPVITWNRTLLHAAVYYLGTSCIARIGEQTGIIEFNPKAAEVTILARLALSLDGEGTYLSTLSRLSADHSGQYYLLSVVADQLRYPSAHTYFYISFMLYLFVFTSRTEQPNSIPDRIGRVLLERIIVQRPHPFGLLVCFVELMEDHQYGFWHQPFAQAPGELHAIFAWVQKNIVRARDDDMDRRAQKQLQAMNEGDDSEYRSSESFDPVKASQTDPQAPNRIL